MVTIAITGGIACGKSLVGQYIRDLGIPVCEADELGHAVLGKGGAAYVAAIEAFGPSVVREDGEIDRGALGRVVFGDPERLALLNALTHPEIMERLRRWTADQITVTGCVAAIIPLLYEIRDEKRWDKVLCVAAPVADQISRLRQRGLTEAEALVRIQAQLAQAEKMERADFVIFNCGGRDMLREQTMRVVRSIRGDEL